ncbi:MAG: hypothetical protein R3D57_00495 [Hyphomicrobiaceae bacterium]
MSKRVRLPQSKLSHFAMPPRRLTENDAIDIWIARWLGLRLKDIVQRYGCDPRRIYEIWWEERFIGSRKKAKAVFAERHPALTDRVDFSRRQRFARPGPDAAQMTLFE